MTEEKRIYNSDGEILARDNFVLAFFGKQPFHEMVDGVSDAFKLWLEIIPEGALKWALIGSNATKYTKATPRALDRCRAMLEKEVASKKDIFFEVLGARPNGSDYRAIVKGFVQPEKKGFADQTNLVEFIFPMNFCAEYGEDRMIDLAALLFSTLSCDSGYAAPALCYGSIQNFRAAGEFIRPLAFHHHGYDIPNNVTTTVFVGSKCRGARWLTMLSDEMVSQTGGMSQLKGLVADGVEILNLSKGVLILAGKKPEIGDVNKRELTPLLSSVAHAIEDITYFHDNSLLPIFDHNAEKRDRWERRFWWDEE